MISSDHLEPGTTGQIKATIDTAGKLGPLEKHISIRSNDLQHPVETLSLSLDIIEKK